MLIVEFDLLFKMPLIRLETKEGAVLWNIEVCARAESSQSSPHIGQILCIAPYMVGLGCRF